MVGNFGAAKIQTAIPQITAKNRAAAANAAQARFFCDYEARSGCFWLHLGCLLLLCPLA
ncbi:hypothetical protein D3C76_1813290 [compost metagenome]